MLMMGGKNKGLGSVIVSRMKKDGEEEVESDSSDDSSAYRSAAGAIVSAVKSDDAEGLARALKSFVKLCNSESEDDEYEEE